MLKIDQLRLTALRKAIRANRVSFPSQVPLFVKSASTDIQRRAVQLYFLCGWSCRKIAKRYGYSGFYIWQIVSDWKRHAVSLGYLQAIPPASALGSLRRALAADTLGSGRERRGSRLEGLPSI
jgi:hypothetical protein